MRLMSRGERAALACVVCALAAGYSAYALLKHWHFDSSYDLAIYDQAIWHLSRFERPASSIRSLPNVFGDHFHPIIALFAPLYWVAPFPETLIVAQAILLAASVVPVFLFARDRLPYGPALAMCLAYGLFWGMQQTAIFDVHEAVFACIAAIDCSKARGSARPISSIDIRTSRRAMYMRSSPASSIRASQYSAASTSLDRTDLCSAEIRL